MTYSVTASERYLVVNPSLPNCSSHAHVFLWTEEPTSILYSAPSTTNAIVRSAVSLDSRVMLDSGPHLILIKDECGVSTRVVG